MSCHIASNIVRHFNIVRPQMLFGLRSSAFFIVNSFGTLLVALCETQEAYSEPSFLQVAYNFLIVQT